MSGHSVSRKLDVDGSVPSVALSKTRGRLSLIRKSFWMAMILLASQVITPSPAFAAAVSPSGIAIGTGSFEVDIAVTTSSAGVTFSYTVEGSPATHSGTLTTGEAMRIVGPILITGTGNNLPGLFVRSSNGLYTQSDLEGETGINGDSVYNPGFTGNYFPQFYETSDVQAISNGRQVPYIGNVTACFGMEAYFSATVRYWHCTAAFTWPEPDDTTPPGMSSRSIDANGATLTIRFNEGMAAATAPSGFAVTRNGSPISFTPGNISQGSSTLELNLGEVIATGDVVRLSYTPGSITDDAPGANALPATSNLTVTNNSISGDSGGPGANVAPAKYSGPEFSGLSGMGVMTGSTGKLEGKRLNEISSIEIGGKAATFTATSTTELSLSLPAALAPGLYDLVINSSAGKLTHINAIQVRAPKQSFSIMTRSQGKISNDQYIEHSLIASMQIPELNKARCVVNASSMAMARAMADRLCAIVKASNPNIETTVVEPRSSVKGDAVFARVSYGWN